ncbi:MAG: hypothetical protein ACJAYU_002891 [Bradymonadia bacterium]|jgi:hypothetical protein
MKHLRVAALALSATALFACEEGVFSADAGGLFSDTASDAASDAASNTGDGFNTPESDVAPGACAPEFDDLSAWPASVRVLPLNTRVDGTATASGDISTGQCTGLDFAEDSSIACFPATQFDDFAGNQVFFALAEPLRADSILKVTVTPTDGADLHVYGYRSNTDQFYVPPAVGSVISCEAGYSPNERGVPETIEFQNPGTREHNVFFAVSGPTDVTAGAFDILVELDVYEPNCPESLPGQTYSAWPSNVNLVTDNSSGLFPYEGNLSSGQCTNVDFAEDSANACFPATIFDQFTGNHVFYALDPPLPGNHDVTISVNGDASISVWGYQTSTSIFQVPPMVANVGICEYGLATNRPDIEFRNPEDSPQNVFFAVAGAQDVTSGAYGVSVVVTPR